VHPVLHHAQRHLRRVIDQPDTLGDADCERLHDGLWGQPVNTVTSFAYVAAGLWLGARTARLPRAQRPGAGWYAAFVAITGAGSVAYHGPQFSGAQLLHDIPIAGVVGIGAVVPLLRRRRGDTAVPGWSPRLGVGMAAAAVVAGASYVGGGTDSPLCRPDSLVQLHGLWHVATASMAAMWGWALWPEAVGGSGALAEEDHPPSFCSAEGVADDTFRRTERGSGVEEAPGG
jgi:hypothetical protein